MIILEAVFKNMTYSDCLDISLYIGLAVMSYLLGRKHENTKASGSKEINGD